MSEQIRVLLERVSPELLLALVAGTLRLLAIFVIAFIATHVMVRVIRGLHARLVARMLRRGDGASVELEKRASTLTGICKRVAAMLIWGIAFVTALRELGYDIGPVLASAGVVGLAIGFGAQNLVRDAITGMFMLLENQIREGDVAVINGTGGLVEDINIRTTVLRSVDGAVHVFPNGQIDTLSNLTLEFSYYVFNMGIAYGEDTDRVVDTMRSVADELMAEEDYRSLILAPLEVLGVDSFGDSAVVIKARIKTVPIKQWAVGRELNRRFKKKFDEVGIEIPFPQRTVHIETSSPTAALGTGPLDRDALKALIRETLAEMEHEPADAAADDSRDDSGDRPGARSSD